MEIDAIEFVRYAKLEYEKTSNAYKKYKKRFFYEEMDSRLNIIYGIRGSGKTTMMFQKYLKTSEKKRIYLHAEEVSNVGLSLIDIFRAIQYLFSDSAIVFLDEINNYQEWYNEIKIIYDKYPKMRFYITGSSSLNIMESKKKLARRAKYIHIPTLTFREYVYLKNDIKLNKFIPGEDILLSAMRYDIYIREKLPNILTVVEEYISTNLPYLFENDYSTLSDLVEKVIYSDIAKVKNIETATLSKFERLIFLLSSSTKTSYEILSKDLGVSKSVVGEMLTLLEKSEIIKKTTPYKKGKTSARKEWKYYFTVPSIRKLYAEKMLIPESDTKGNIKEDIFVSNFPEVFFSDIDFVWKKYLIEIGSKKKGFKQFKDIKTKLKKIIIYMGLDITRKNDVYKFPFYVFYSIL